LTMIRKIIALNLCLMMTFGCVHGPAGQKQEDSFSDPSVAYFDQREAEMGRQIHQAIVTSFRVYTEPQVVDYVTKTGEAITKYAGRHDLHYRFTVLYDSRVYATEAPGGYIYVTTGFLNFLENEAELSALLATEIAMLQFRDPRLSGSRKALKALTQAGTVMAPMLGQIGILAAAGLVLLNVVSDSKDLTPEEKLRRSDEKALTYMVEAGQDPQGYLDLYGRILRPDPKWSPYLYDYLSSHPVTLDRYQQILKQFEQLPLSDKSFQVHHERYLEMTRGVREIYAG